MKCTEINLSSLIFKFKFTQSGKNIFKYRKISFHQVKSDKISKKTSVE